MSKDNNLIKGCIISEKSAVTMEIYNQTEKKSYYYFIGNLDNENITLTDYKKKVAIPINYLRNNKTDTKLKYSYILDEIKISNKNNLFYVFKFLQPNKYNEWQFSCVKIDDDYGNASIIEAWSDAYLLLPILKDKREVSVKSFDDDDLPF